MKITIELNEAEVKGIKAYLRDIGSVGKPTKEHIKAEIQGIVSTTLHSPREAMNDYISQYEN